MRAYENVIRNTATDYAPWHVVPADHKWFTRLVVAEVILDALESLELSYSKVSPAKGKEIATVRTALLINKALRPPGARRSAPTRLTVLCLYIRFSSASMKSTKLWMSLRCANPACSLRIFSRACISASSFLG